MSMIGSFSEAHIKAFSEAVKSEYIFLKWLGINISEEDSQALTKLKNTSDTLIDMYHANPMNKEIGFLIGDVTRKAEEIENKYRIIMDKEHKAELPQHLDINTPLVPSTAPDSIEDEGVVIASYTPDVNCIFKGIQLINGELQAVFEEKNNA